MELSVVITLMAIFWFICAVFTYALALYDLEEQFPAGNGKEHILSASITTVMGPIGLLVIILTSKKCGFRFYPRTVDEKWEIFHKTYGWASREYFNDLNN